MQLNLLLLYCTLPHKDENNNLCNFIRCNCHTASCSAEVQVYLYIRIYIIIIVSQSLAAYQHLRESIMYLAHLCKCFINTPSYPQYLFIVDSLNIWKHTFNKWIIKLWINIGQCVLSNVRHGPTCLQSVFKYRFNEGENIYIRHTN